MSRHEAQSRGDDTLERGTQLCFESGLEFLWRAAIECLWRQRAVDDAEPFSKRSLWTLPAANTWWTVMAPRSATIA